MPSNFVYYVEQVDGFSQFNGMKERLSLMIFSVYSSAMTRLSQRNRIFTVNLCL